MRRTFERSQPLTALLQVRRRDAGDVVPPAVHIRVVDQQNRPVLDALHTIDAARFDASGVATVVVAIPTTELAQGSYLLAAELDEKRRAVMFDVQ